MQANVWVRPVAKVFRDMTLRRGWTVVVKAASCLVNVHNLPCAIAPFARASCEGDYRVAWAFFESTAQREAAR